MLQALARNWWVLLIRGIAAILFGILAFTWPGITLAVLVILYGIYALIDGASAIGLGMASFRRDRSWWEMVSLGILGVAAGIITFMWPGITTIALLVIIAVYAIVRGVLEIVAAIRLRKVIPHEWLLALAGVLSIIFGVIMLARPLIGALAIVWLIGFWAILFGVTAVALSLRLYTFKKQLEPTSPTSALPT
jgi:uncharacterized membrane protein HdeD (DUF308 family)